MTAVRVYRAGLEPPDSAPIVSVAPTTLTLEAAAEADLIGFDSDVDGTIVSRAWTLGGSTVGTSATLHITAPIGTTDQTLTYTYTAVDNGGASASANVVVTVLRATLIRKNTNGTFTGFITRTKDAGGGGGGNPAPVLVDRFRASSLSGAEGAGIAAWNGINGGQSVQSTPTNQPKLRLTGMNGAKAVEFSSNQLLQLQGGILDAFRNRTNMIVFVVYKLPSTAVTNTRTLIGFSTGTGTVARAGVYQNVTAVNTHQAAGRRLDSDAFVALTTPTGSTTGESAILTVEFRYETSTLIISKNGSVVATSSTFQTAGATSDTRSQTGHIGASSAGTAEFFAGMIGDISIYSGVDIDGSFKASIHSALSTEWGIPVAGFNTAMPAVEPAGWERVTDEDFVGTAYPVGSFVVGAAGTPNDGLILSTAPTFSRYRSKIKFYPDGSDDTYGSSKAYVSKAVSTRNDVAGADGVLDIHLHTETIGGVATAIGSWQRLLLPSGLNDQLGARVAYRFRCDPAPGYGAVFLMIPHAAGDWPDNGELDWPEGDLDDPLHGFYHFADPAGGQIPVTAPGSPSWNDWHIAVQEWIPGVSVKWYLDGALVFSTTDRVGTGPLKIVTPQIGGSSGTPPASSVSAHFQLDWVTIAEPGSDRGINLSGAEFSPEAAKLPGVYNTDYMYPSTGVYATMAAKGHRMIRLPFRWERIQPTLGAALNSAELTRLTAAVDAAGAAGLKVLLDCHNYARFINSTVNGGATLVLGGGTLTNAHLVDLWTRLSTAFKANRNVLGYGLMNEPHDLPGVSGSFVANNTPFTFDVTAQSWTVEISGTVARSTATVHDGAGSLQVTRTLAAGAGQLIRVNDANTNTMVSTNGTTITAWVLVPSGAPGTNWQARLEMQNSAFAWQAGAYTTLTPGTWAQISYTPSDTTWAGHLGIGVQFSSTQTTAPSVSVYVDTVQQGTIGGQVAPAQQWEAASQAVVSAIRANTDTTRIFVGGYQFSGAQNWATNHPAPWITDPANKTTYEAHYYFDMTNEGVYAQTYAAANTAAVGAGFASLLARATTQISVFANWCQANGVRGFVGEVGWPNNVDTASWNAVGEAVYDVLDAAKIGAAYWAAGEWYGTTYNLSAYTGTNLATDAPPAAIVRAHPYL